MAPRAQRARAGSAMNAGALIKFPALFALVAGANVPIDVLIARTFFLDVAHRALPARGERAHFHLDPLPRRRRLGGARAVTDAAPASAQFEYLLVPADHGAMAVNYLKRTPEVSAADALRPWPTIAQRPAAFRA